MDKVKVTFWGVRGSMAAPGAKTVIFGGNTACIEIESGKTRIICDAGTGIRMLGRSLVKRSGKKPISAHILLSHLHLDHYIGLPFFRPLYNQKNKLVVCGPKGGKMDFGKALLKAICPPYFPVPLPKMPARLTFKTLSTKSFKIGNVKVVPISLFHPGGSLGWRFYFPNGKSLVHITDNEPKDGAHMRKLIEWMDGADVLIHDSQYTPENYKYHMGWGHSPYTYPIELAALAGIKRVFLFHYDPAEEDSQLKRVSIAAKKLAKIFSPKLHCEMSKEGMRIGI